MKKKVVNKGYTITVNSWENDGDNSRTESITVDSLEEAQAYVNLMKLCKSENQSTNGIGNANDFEPKHMRRIRKCLKENPILLKGEDINLNDDGEEADEELVDFFNELVSPLLGNSEFYACRVMENYTVTHSSEDVYSEQIKL